MMPGLLASASLPPASGTSERGAWAPGLSGLYPGAEPARRRPSAHDSCTATAARGASDYLELTGVSPQLLSDSARPSGGRRDGKATRRAGQQLCVAQGHSPRGDTVGLGPLVAGAVHPVRRAPSGFARLMDGSRAGKGASGPCSRQGARPGAEGDRDREAARARRGKRSR